MMTHEKPFAGWLEQANKDEGDIDRASGQAGSCAETVRRVPVLRSHKLS